MKFTGERCILGESGPSVEKEHLERYNFALKFVENRVVLDVACGSGYGSSILAQKAKKVIGVDISKESINYAKEKFSSKKINFVNGSATNLRFIKDGTIDVVVSFETIEHLKDYRLFLLEIKRVLKRGGPLIISTPNKKFFSHKLKKPLIPFHFIEFYMNDFYRLLSNYFTECNLYGQDRQTLWKSIKRRIIKLFPYWFRRVFISKEVSNSYHSKNIWGITKIKPEECRFFISICKK